MQKAEKREASLETELRRALDDNVDLATAKVTLEKRVECFQSEAESSVFAPSAVMLSELKEDLGAAAELATALAEQNEALQAELHEEGAVAPSAASYENECVELQAAVLRLEHEVKTRADIEQSLRELVRAAAMGPGSPAHPHE